MNERIEEKLDDLQTYVSKLQRYSSYDREEIREDEEIQATVERYLNLSIEIVIQICQMIIAQENYEKPDTYRQAIEILGNHDVLPEAFAQQLAPVAGLRNLLIHRYGEVDPDEVITHLKNDIDDFDTFAKHAAKYAAEREQ